MSDVIERRKSLGVVYPAWIAGPCHNPECPDYVPEQVPITSVRARTWRDAAGWKRR
ncbi:hypothetical protein [Streptomyces decoyicus]|uniref:hypothetical protein n=1 Tax=Streptomyces decoyicus TaxID=249567 RepID=UPI00364E3375